MICIPCKAADHRDCDSFRASGRNPAWCDCQHQPAAANP
jgi:hypothetical protein